MNGSSKLWIVVPAAGSGSRMGSETPKQYLPLNGATLLERTLSRLLQLEPMTKLLLVLSSRDQHWSQSSLANDGRIELVTGGEERCHSVLNALQHLQALASPQDWVLVHDAARPCVRVDEVQAMFEQLQDDSVGGIMAVPVSDTLKTVDAQQQIIRTVDRTGLWQAQTPQLFRFALLHEALMKALEKNLAVTDEAMAMEYCGHSVKIVEGRRDNIKVTRQEDLALAELITQSQPPVADEK